jgi:hydrogenase maturation protein HypF
MLPYTPIHHLLFAEGAPEVLVMTSANRSSEPIAFDDVDALSRLSGIADAFLIGERPIARRVDDSIVRAGALGPAVLRSARGYAPSAVAVFPSKRPILALGADLKNTVTLVVDGQAFVSQHIGDLEHFESFQALEQTIEDLVSMYEIRWDDLLVVNDCHPQYASTAHASALSSSETRSVQHHRAHIASVLAERGEWNRRVVGVCFDGTGYGDDGTIWGGEFFAGSISEGFERIAHLRRAILPGGDAAAHFPVQAAAGFLAQLEDLPDVNAEPFHFPERFWSATELIRKGVRTFITTSMGRLFDAAAALLGFTRETTFEGQAAMWVEQLARSSPSEDAYPFPFDNHELDFRPLLANLAHDRFSGRAAGECARAFQKGVALGVFSAAAELCREHDADTIVLSGGVFQNELLLEDLKSIFASTPFRIWTNHEVPANDGGISLGQAALASFGRFNDAGSLNQKKLLSI